jgi:ribulose-phosphate 3-epimerase
MRPPQLAVTRVAPSILAADFSQLGAQVREVLDAGAKVIHVDVMDGHFVPPITMGPLAVSALRDIVAEYEALLDVHLMIERPERQIAEFVKAGAGSITIHAEATPHLDYVLCEIRGAGLGASLAVCPSTPLAVYGEVRDYIDMALCMTVNPGWGGQEFIDASPGKIARLRDMLADGVALEVDGGITLQTASRCAQAGATTFVAGTAVLGSADPAAAYVALAQAVGDPRR